MAAVAGQKVVERPFGRFERMLALRYLGAKREHGGLALISIVSVIGITLGVWALILTMSIMNGFRLELISKILGFEPHAYVDTMGLPQPQVDTYIEQIAMRPGVVAVEPFLEATALASAHSRSEGIQVRGVRPADLRANTLITDGMKKLSESREVGTLETFGQPPPPDPDGFASPRSDTVVVGAALADALGLFIGDRLSLTQPSGRSTVVGRAPRTVTFTVSGIFHVGNERYDRYSVFVPLEEAKSLFGYDEGYPIVGVRLQNPNDATNFANVLMKDQFPYTQTWIDRNGTYITALVVERNVMRLILFIVVIITALNIITGVLMLVKNKARDVAILRTIGATRWGVVRVFLMTGTFLGMAGVGIGVALGVLCALYIAPIQHFLEGLFGFELFPADIYQLDALPAKLEWMEVTVVGIAAFIVTLVMSVIPSMWAARLNPVEALRFE
jgi:lipoprotein-releasing system permease protein